MKGLLLFDTQYRNFMVQTKIYCTILAAMSAIQWQEDTYIKTRILNITAKYALLYRTFCINHDNLATTVTSGRSIKYSPRSVIGDTVTALLKTESPYHTTR
jgi:hypothetical protein